MKTLPLYFPNRRRGRQAFTLIELLVVMATLAMLSAMMLPAVSGTSEGSQLNSGILNLSGALDLARQYAISKNTYTWVLLNPGEGNASTGAQIAIISSKSGTDSVAWTTSSLDLPATTGGAMDLEIVDKVRSLPFVRIVDTPTVDFAGSAIVGSFPPAPANISIQKGGQKINFSGMLQFTPSGEARRAKGLDRYIALAVLPQKKHGNVDSPNQAALRITGINGKLNIFRP